MLDRRLMEIATIRQAGGPQIQTRKAPDTRTEDPKLSGPRTVEPYGEIFRDASAKCALHKAPLSRTGWMEYAASKSYGLAIGSS